MRLVLLGPPGAGKGTQGGVPRRALRDPADLDRGILRDHVQRGYEARIRARSYMDRGEYVPDDARRLDGDGSTGTTPTRTRASSSTGSRAPWRRPRRSSGRWRRGRSPHGGAEVLGRRRARRPAADREIHMSQLRRTYHMEYKPPAEDELCDICGATLERRADDDELTARRRLAVYREQSVAARAVLTPSGTCSTRWTPRRRPDEVIDPHTIESLEELERDHPEIGGGDREDAEGRPDRGRHDRRRAGRGRARTDHARPRSRGGALHPRSGSDPLVQGVPRDLPGLDLHLDRCGDRPRHPIGHASSRREGALPGLRSDLDGFHGDAAVTVFVGGQPPSRRPRSSPRRRSTRSTSAIDAIRVGGGSPTSATRSSPWPMRGLGRGP